MALPSGFYPYAPGSSLNPTGPPAAPVAAVVAPVYVHTVIGGFVFDAYFSVQHDGDVTITTHPVESGAAVADNAYVNPQKLTFDIGMSDCCTDIIPGQFSGGVSRSVTAYSVLQTLKAQRIPMQVTTRLATYNNMLVQSISVQDTNKTAHGLRATVVLQEIFVAVVKTVQISARPQTTDSTPKGTVQPVQPSQSILSQISQALTGSPTLQ